MDETNYYRILGLDPSYQLDARALEERYLERSKLYHPDRHALADGPTRVKNALAASELNQAYRVLRDPVARAEHLLGLHGVVLGDERTATSKVDQAFLMEMMELREALGEARARGDERTMLALAADVRGRRERALAHVAAGFAALEQGGSEPEGAPERTRTLTAIADALAVLRYYRRFLDEIEAAEDALEDGWGSEQSERGTHSPAERKNGGSP
jgi:molecular chaperone HscB